MPIEFSNLYCEDICRKNLQNFILELSNSKEIYNKYSYEECYRMYYNLYIKNEKSVLDEWISDLIISLKKKSKIIRNIVIISDVLLYILSQKVKYKNIVLDKKKFISLCNDINSDIIKKRVSFICSAQDIFCGDIIKKIVLEY
tara:strand:- start:54 stop:482 length:429 start_codon:yes stop_codon:yes gene_type:complete